MPIQFTDHYKDYNGGSHFSVTNEEPFLHAYLLDKYTGGKTFPKAGVIASGGEIPLLAIAPVCDSVVAIDHNYGSLAFAAAKILLLETLGPRELYERMLYAHERGLVVALFASVSKDLPDVLRPHFDKVLSDYYSCSTLRKYWSYFPLAMIERGAAHCHKIHLVHGDFNDLVEFGAPFDLLYVSNATSTSHYPRGSKNSGYGAGGLKPNFKTLATDGCIVIHTAGDREPHVALKECEPLGPSVSSTQDMTWHYHLLRYSAKSAELKKTKKAA